MKKNLLFLFLLFSFNSHAQTFDLTDSVFHVGDIYRIKGIEYKTCEPPSWKKQHAFLDSLAVLLKKNDSITIEIGSFSDSRGTVEYNNYLTNTRSKYIYDYLTSKGVSAERLSAKGYGESKLLISDAEIEKMQTDEEKEAAHEKNRRTELKILRTDYKKMQEKYNPFFSLKDTVITNKYTYRTYGILFDYTGATIRAESYPLLDSIVDFMKRNKNLVIEVGVHADSRGSDMYSSKPTIARAKAICDYLVSKGISPERLVSVGYGEERVLITDRQIEQLPTEEEKELAHQKNRRVELVILRTDFKEQD